MDEAHNPLMYPLISEVQTQSGMTVLSAYNKLPVQNI